jgi:hypothetical protein
MKVIPFDRFIEIKNISRDNHKKTIDLNSRYEMSSKVQKINKKKGILTKICFDLTLKQTSEINTETKWKSILMSLNKIHKDNVNTIVTELKSISIEDYQMMNKLSESILKKILIESNYWQYYFQVIQIMSEYDKWTVIFNNKYSINFKEAFILKVQETFEKNIKNCEKDYGIRLMQTLAKLYIHKWVNTIIFENIINSFLSKKDTLFLEYIIIFLKESKYESFEKIKEQILNTTNLPTRLNFMLEE